MARPHLRIRHATCAAAVGLAAAAALPAQTYRERGRNQAKTIRFDYRVPNG